MMSALTLDGVNVALGGRSILRDVSVRVEAGSICGLFGLNGSGKSTLLKVAAGQVRPSSGAVTIDGQAFCTPRIPDRFEHLAYLSQDSMLPPDITVGRLVRSVGAKPDALLSMPRLSRWLKLRVGALSGGEKRYVELALLLALNRRYILLDEPFTGMTPLTIDEVTGWLTDAAAQGVGILITDHDYRAVLSVVDTGCLVKRGRCTPLGEKAMLRDALQDTGYLPKR